MVPEEVVTHHRRATAHLARVYRTILAALVLAVFAACSNPVGPDRDADAHPRPVSNSEAASALSHARNQLTKPYEWAGNGPEVFEFVNASSYFGEVAIDTWPVDGEKRDQWYVGAGRLVIPE